MSTLPFSDILITISSCLRTSSFGQEDVLKFLGLVAADVRRRTFRPFPAPKSPPYVGGYHFQTRRNGARVTPEERACCRQSYFSNSARRFSSSSRSSGAPFSSASCLSCARM